MVDEVVPRPHAGFRVVASSTSTRGAVLEAGRIVVFDTDGFAPVAELGIEGGPDDHDVAFTTDRMIVLSRAASSSVVHVVDPAGPTKLGEVPFRTPVRMFAVAGDLVLVAGTGVTGIIDTTRVTFAALPLRAAVTAAGALARDRFVIAAGGVLEEWDGVRRAPGRRLRLDRPIDPLFVGGRGERLWLVPRSEPDQLDVITLDVRSSKRFQLPERPARAAAHATDELIGFVGATTGVPYVVEIGKTTSVVTLEHGPVTDLAWVASGRSLVMFGQDGVLDLFPLATSRSLADEATPLEPAPTPRTASTAQEVSVEEPPTRWSRDEISHRLARWRERYQQPSAAPTPAEPAPPSPRPAPVTPPVRTRATTSQRRDAPHPGGWRAELAIWARAVTSRSHRDPPTIDRGVLDEVHARLGLAPNLVHAHALLYGAHLIGVAQVSTYDLASVLAWSWDEALGAGALGAAGTIAWRRASAHLVDVMRAALDERPPLTGEVIPAAEVNASTGAIVAPDEIEPARVAMFAAPTIGALLVPNRRGERAPRPFLLEAQLRGLIPLVPWARFASALSSPPARAAIVVDRASTAASLDLPVVATWSGTPLGD